MKKGRRSKRKRKHVKPNINHFAHQVGVTGVGTHKSKKKYTRKAKHKGVIK